MSTPARDAEELIRRLEGPRIWNYRLELAGLLLVAAVVATLFLRDVPRARKDDVALPLHVPGIVTPVRAGTRVTLVVTSKDKAPLIVAARVMQQDPPTVVVLLPRSDALRVAERMPAEVSLLLEPR